MLETIADGVIAATSELRVGPGFWMPVRSTIVRLASGGLLVWSPIAFDDATAAAIDLLGRVEVIAAPNLLHHMFLAAAKLRWPSARIVGPAGLAAKLARIGRPIALDETLDPAGGWTDTAVRVVHVAGSPALDEFVLLHRASRSLVVTDLVFHILAPRGALAGMILSVVGANGRLAQSRALRFMTKDRAAAGQSARTILDLEFDRLIPAHGAILAREAPTALRSALGPMLAGAR